MYGGNSDYRKCVRGVSVKPTNTWKRRICLIVSLGFLVVLLSFFYAALCVSLLAQESEDAKHLQWFKNGLSNSWKKSTLMLLNIKLPLLFWKLLNCELGEDSSVENMQGRNFGAEIDFSIVVFLRIYSSPLMEKIHWCEPSVITSGVNYMNIWRA